MISAPENPESEKPRSGVIRKPEKGEHDVPRFANSANDAWLKLALESARMCAYEWDLTTDLIMRSDDSSAEDRVDPNSDSWIYHDGIKNIYPDDRAFVEEQISEAIRTHENFSVEFRVCLREGPVRCLQVNGCAIYDENGRATRVLSVSQEITQRKKEVINLRNQKLELETTKQ
jgi:PAS domain-containing protein